MIRTGFAALWIAAWRFARAGARMVRGARREALDTYGGGTG